VAIADDTGGVILAWDDWRAEVLVGGNYMGDIFAQRVQSNGKLGGAVVVPR
jgi:hypothetical protein